MGPGTVVGGRFEIVEEAGRGGMAIVYRANDLAAAGKSVALKILPVGGETERFAREAKVLARLEHPTIVPHVASGETDDGLLYLAMEWLDGEDLADRIGREGLLVTDSLGLARRMAEALGAAHALGIVHRDVKPSNIYLVHGDVEQAKLVDFGIASFRHGTQPLTATGAFVGTLGYVAPEHADGSRNIDGRADIYSLGCVLFECLTGTPAIEGTHALEVLAKTMLEGVPDVRTRRPDLHPALAELVKRMTAQKREERFANTVELCAAIDALRNQPGEAAPSFPTRVRLTGEQRLASIAMLINPDASLVGSSTLTPAMLEEQERRVHALVRRFGGEMRVLSTGLLVTMTGGSSAVDLAVAATECALALRTLHPQAEAVLATGRIDANFDVSSVVRRALSLLEHGRGRGLLRVDETTAGLIASRFVLRDEEGVTTVLHKTDADSPVRTLLGKPTPCVGREKELALLEATLDECIDESAARVFLITAPPGTGKSRLRSELSGRVEATRPGVRTLTTSADHAASRSALAVAAALVLEAAGSQSGATASSRFERIRAHVTSLSSKVAPERAQGLAEMLSEMCDAPSTLPPSDTLIGARNDPRIMNERMQRAFEEWIGLLARDAPLLLVLEDMHWADAASLTYLASALKRSHDAAIMLLGLARPEIHEALPDLLGKGAVQEIRLGGITKRAAERLVRFALPQIENERVIHIVERADGNPFYLEELVRWAATGAQRPADERTGSVGGSITQLPDTVLLMVQSRIEQLAPTARQVLRAASVFGNAAWIEGIATLLGGTVDASAWVESLVHDEILVHESDSRFPGLHEVVFRHGLLREASYATLTDEDRVEAHATAARWLEAVGESDPLLLAEHHERGKSPGRAAPLFLRAAQHAAEAANLSSAIALSQRGLDSGATAETRALLLATRAHAHGWRAEWSDVLAFAPAAMDLLEPGSVAWWLMAGGIVFASASTANPTLVPGIFQKVIALPALPEPTGPCGFALTLFVMGSLSSGLLEAARAFLARFEQIQRANEDRDRDFGGWLRLARDGVALYTEDDIATAWREVQEGVQLFDEAMDPVGAPLARVYAGTVALEAGDAEHAEALFLDAERMAEASDVHYAKVIARGYRIRSRTYLGHHDDALALAESGFKERDAFLWSLARSGAAETYLAKGELERAKKLAEEVLLAPARISIPQTQACSVLARAALAQGDLESTLAHSERGLGIAACTALPRCRSELLIGKAEALARLRRREESAAARLEASSRVERIARGLSEAGYTRLESTWMRVPANRLATMAP